jgi:hypothetical protein
MTKDGIKAMLDGSYETPAATSGSKFKTTTNFGFGASFKLSNKVNISLEERVTMLRDDLLDGVKYYYSVPLGSANAAPIVSNRNDLYNFFSVGVNINLF